jgi:hypothetical protein
METKASSSSSSSCGERKVGGRRRRRRRRRNAGKCKLFLFLSSVKREAEERGSRR